MAIPTFNAALLAVSDTDANGMALEYPLSAAKITQFIKRGIIGDYEIIEPVDYVGVLYTDINRICAVGRFIESWKSNGRSIVYCVETKFCSQLCQLTLEYPVRYCTYDPKLELFI